MLPTRRFLGLMFLLGSTAVALSTIGCGRQKEGERCLLLNGNADCDANEDLICTPAGELRGGDDEIDRCCPSPNTQPSDARCARRTTPGDGDGDGDNTGTGGMGGSSGGSGEVEGGACVYNSDCASHLKCGFSDTGNPGGTCIPECNQTRDCPSGQICTPDRICQ